MKKSLLLILSLCVLFSLTACTVSDSEPQQPEPAQSEQVEQQTTPTPDANTEDEAEITETPSVVTIQEQVLVDEKDIKITAKELVVDGAWGAPELKLLFENNSGLNLTIQTRASSINGYMIDTIMSTDVASGKKANDSLEFSETGLENCGIETIADMEFYFHIFDFESWDTYLDTDIIRIETSAAETYEYTFDDSGNEIFNENGIRVVYKGFYEGDSWFDPGLILYIENLSEQSITVQPRDTSVNGFMIDASLSEEVAAGKRAITVMSFYQSSLDENNIERITDVEFNFHIFETDGWDTIIDSDIISVST